MSPITKIWLFSLQPGRTTSEAAFTALWDEALSLVNSYTQAKPGAKDREQHVLYQGETDPSQLALVTGYPSLELSLEADRVYASAIMPRMFNIVRHRKLMVLETDVDELPLQGGRITVSLTSAQPDQSQGVGGWDVWQLPGAQEPPPQTTWVHITATGEGGSETAVSWELKRIRGI